MRIFLQSGREVVVPHGYTLIELLVVIAIIGILGGIIATALFGARAKALDARRKTEISSIGRILKLNCYVPDAGVGDYDLAPILSELRTKNPQYANQIPELKDPSSGTASESKYRYIVNSAGKCAMYANLQNEAEKVTLFTISTPTAGGGTGVFEATSNGRNGSPKYFQVSN